MHGHKTEQFIKMLTPEYQKIFSYVIDEIERETYWETRQDILQKIKKHFKIGDAEKYVDYLISKPKPK